MKINEKYFDNQSKTVQPYLEPGWEYWHIKKPYYLYYKADRIVSVKTFRGDIRLIKVQPVPDGNTIEHEVDVVSRFPIVVQQAVKITVDVIQ